MDKFKQQIQQKLVANIIVDKCSHCGNIIFRDSWCTQERIIRFTTPLFRMLFPKNEDGEGKWKTGDHVMYEVNNGTDSFDISCVLSLYNLPYSLMSTKDKMLKECGVKRKPNTSDVVLKRWSLSGYSSNDELFSSFDHFLSIDLIQFESDLSKTITDDSTLMLKEGAHSYVTLNKYERNATARQACLASHGTACAVCGIDFGKEYGLEFAGKIEVHHIVPISQIGEEYVVDPVKDLIPVCPNCHAALHSKKDGVYTVEELKEIRKRTKELKK